MTIEKLAEATREYDGMVIGKTVPLNARERKLWAQAKRGRGRPKIGNGAKKVSISMEGDLLRQIDAAAKKMGANRSEPIAGLVSAGLKRQAI